MCSRARFSCTLGCGLAMWIGKSILQEGHGFPVLLPELYQYMVSRDITTISIDDKEITDQSVKCLVAEICVQNG